MKKWEKKAISEIMDCFDFNRVHAVTKKLCIKWASSTETPTLSELKQQAETLLTDCVTENCFWMGTGGFIVCYIPKYKHLSLIFSIEDWSYEHAKENMD